MLRAKQVKGCWAGKIKSALIILTIAVCLQGTGPYLYSHLILTSTLWDHDHYPILRMRKLGTKDTKLAHHKARKQDNLIVQDHCDKVSPYTILRTAQSSLSASAWQSGASQCIQHGLPCLSNLCRVHVQADSHSWLYAMRKAAKIKADMGPRPRMA